MSKTRQMPYYFNRETNESRWEPPAGTDMAVLQSHLTTTVSNSSNSPSERIRVRHLLVKHAQSRRPSSWKEENITRTPEEARKILEGYQAQISSGSISLGELAASESDCSSYRKHGDLGFFGKGEMQPEFEEAAFKLKVGAISPIVSTQSGLHLIERIA